MPVIVVVGFVKRGVAGKFLRPVLWMAGSGNMSMTSMLKN